MKTVKEWFESIKDEDVRRRALANCDPNYLHCECLSLATAIGVSFAWGDTDKNSDYWLEQYNKALNNEL